MNIPQRFSEAAFRRYEPTIVIVMTNWPLVQTFDPAPLSAETFANRLRDSMRSLMDYGWKTDINTGRFIELRAEISVRIRNDGRVIVGPRLTPITFTNETTPEANNTVFKVTAPPPAVIQALFTLLHNRLITQVIVVEPNEIVINEYAEGFDVAVIRKGDHLIIV